MIAFYTIIRKEICRILRIWSQTLLPSLVTVSLYFIIFGYIVGSHIESMGGREYIEYIMPGLIMMSIIINSYSNVSSSFFNAKFYGNLEEILISPVSNAVIIWGYVLGGVFRGLIVGFLALILGLFFTHISIDSFFITSLIAILTAILFSLAGFLNGLLAQKFDDVAMVPTFILTPLNYLGGIFYSITVLPTFWQYITKLNPIFYIVNAFRDGILGGSEVSLCFSIGITSLLIIFLYLLLNWLLSKEIRIRN